MIETVLPGTSEADLARLEVLFDLPPVNIEPVDYQVLPACLRVLQDRWWEARGRRYDVRYMGDDHRKNIMGWLEKHAERLRHEVTVVVVTVDEFLGYIEGSGPVDAAQSYIGEVDAVDWIRTTPLYRRMKALNDGVEIKPEVEKIEYREDDDGHPMVLLRCGLCDAFADMERLPWMADDGTQPGSAASVALGHLQEAHSDHPGESNVMVIGLETMTDYLQRTHGVDDTEVTDDIPSQPAWVGESL